MTDFISQDLAGSVGAQAVCRTGPSRTPGTLHPDYASLRRYLVDEELLTRSGGQYWRSGGTVPTACAK